MTDVMQVRLCIFCTSCIEVNLDYRILLKLSPSARSLLFLYLLNLCIPICVCRLMYDVFYFFIFELCTRIYRMPYDYVDSIQF